MNEFFFSLDDKNIYIHVSRSEVDFLEELGNYFVPKPFYLLQFIQVL